MIVFYIWILYDGNNYVESFAAKIG